MAQCVLNIVTRNKEKLDYDRFSHNQCHPSISNLTPKYLISTLALEVLDNPLPRMYIHSGKSTVYREGIQRFYFWKGVGRRHLFFLGEKYSRKEYQWAEERGERKYKVRTLSSLSFYSLCSYFLPWLILVSFVYLFLSLSYEFFSSVSKCLSLCEFTKPTPKLPNMRL